MISKLDLLLQKINWEYVILYSFYAFLGLVALIAINAGQIKRKDAEEYCTDKRGILLQDKGGDFLCIKQKSIIKWPEPE